MHFFDWGLFKPWGGMTFLVSAVLYCSALWGSGTAWWRVFNIAKHRFIAAFLALCVIGVMTFMAGGSLLLQLTSVHHQDSVHFPAVIIIVMGVVLSMAVEAVSKKKVSEASHH